MGTHKIFWGLGLVLLALGLCAGRGLAIDSAGSGFWDVGGTWVGGNVPTLADDVIIKAGHTVTSRDALTHDAKSLVIENTGVLTHTANSTTAAGELYKIILNIANNLTINLGAQINVEGKGYTSAQGPGGYTTNFLNGGHHGGKGASTLTVPYGELGPTYGSITAPTNLGSGGYGTMGGGAVRLIVSGTTTVEGMISAVGGTNTGTYRGSAGGSVFLTTGALAGNGTIKANGGISSQCNGGGGRVAVVLTNSTDFGSVKLQAYAGNSAVSKGAGGTVYLENTSHAPGRGKLIVDYNNIVPADRTNCLTLQNGLQPSSYAFSEIILTNGAVYKLGTNDTLDLTDTVLRGDPSSAFDGIYLSGGTLAVPANFALSNNYLWLAITMSNSTFNPAASLKVETNALLRIDAPFTFNCPVTVAGGGVIQHTGNLSNYPAATNLTINGDLNVLPGGVVTANSTVVNGNLNIQSNGVLTHAKNGLTALGEQYKLILNVAGNLTIDAGGQIHADGQGYPGLQGPSYVYLCGGSHGGKGGTDPAGTNVPGSTYGSITAPTNLGSGGYSYSAAGGAAILNVGGTSLVNGVISAGSLQLGPSFYQGAAGGSVFLTTGVLTGNGTLRANGNGSTANGGGGRVAVVLTASTNFSGVKTQASEGGTSGNKGAAGTVYLQTAEQGPGQGTLLIDANNILPAPPRVTTLISSNVRDTLVGNVVLTNRAVLQIDTNQSLTVNGSWYHETNSTFIANTNSTLVLGGTNAGTIYGSNTFYNLACTNAGKTVLFASGATNFVNGNLLLGAGVTLKSTSDDAWWYLTLTPGGTQQVGAVSVQDSNAGGGQTIVANKGSRDLGHNLNWIFLKYPGTVFRIR